MSEKLFKFLLSKVTAIRVHCRNKVCGGVVEIPIDKLGILYRDCTCPLCRQPFDSGEWDAGGIPLHSSNLFRVYAEVIKRLNAIKDRVEIEFVVPDPDKESN
jgi:hypothetical protein